MTAWTGEELNQMGNAEEMEISSLRQDGTLRKQVIIWLVRLGDDLYVRCAYGRSGAWFRGALTCHAGHVSADGINKDVTFVEETDPVLNDRLDEVYRVKYRRYPPSVEHINSAEARTAAIRLVAL